MKEEKKKQERKKKQIKSSCEMCEYYLYDDEYDYYYCDMDLDEDETAIISDTGTNTDM